MGGGRQFTAHLGARRGSGAPGALGEAMRGLAARDAANWVRKHLDSESRTGEKKHLWSAGRSPSWQPSCTKLGSVVFRTHLTFFAPRSLSWTSAPYKAGPKPAAQFITLTFSAESDSPKIAVKYIQ